MEKMLTKQNVTAESTHVEAIPINLIASEDGRTLLAVTERRDGVLEIVAAPVTFVGQSGAATSLVDVKSLNGNLILHSPLFQMNIEDCVDGSERGQPVQSFEADPPAVHDQGGAEEAEVPTSPRTVPAVDQERVAPEANETTGPPAKTTGPGRPKKCPAVASRGSERWKCDICQQEFAKQTLHRKHMENHAEEKPHRCPKCSASFNVPTNFTLHMATHNTGDPRCPECGKKFARMASLKSHMLLHEKEENLFCAECEDAFPTKVQLDAHLKLHGEKWTTEEARKCRLCNKQFSQPALYRLHIREHYKAQTKVVRQTRKGTRHKTMYKCTICLKSFQKPSQLMRHLRVHTGEKPFKCTVCGRAFTQKGSLQIHMWQHNGIRPHACELCNAKFSQKGNLNAHVTRVHNVPDGEPIYGCNYCTCVFKKLGSLNGHMKRMHTDVNEETSTVDGDAESDIRATVNSVIDQLASLEANADVTAESGELASMAGLSQQSIARKDILQQALRNSGLPSKNKTAAKGPTSEAGVLEARTNFVTLLDRAPDGGTRKYLTIKQRCAGNVRWYACTFCHKEFKKPSDLIRHLRVHTQEKPFKCTHCYRSFALKSTMIAHERTHSAAKRYACGACEKTFACHGSLIAHARLHGKSGERAERSDEIAEVEDAPALANQAGSQGRGRSKLSPEAQSLMPRVVLQEPLVISDTGNEIRVAQVPSKENRGHAGPADPARPHKCWVCQAAFRKISHLKQHHRRHTGERPYKCSKCDRRFTSNSVLKSHLHTHDDARPYGCSICNAKFSTQSSMKRHLVTHSNRRPFMCPYCHKTFKTYVNCRKHMKIHKQELAERQLEEQRLQIHVPGTGRTMLADESSKRDAYNTVAGSGSSVDSTAVVANATSAVMVATSPAAYSDNLGLPRIESVEISFEPQMGTDFSQALAEFQSIAGEKEKVGTGVPGNVCDGAAFIDQNVAGLTVANLEHSQILHADETGSVTLPVYTGDHALTPESIRELEETLNQQFLNIGLNLNLGSNQTRLSHGADVTGFDDAKEQQQQQQQHRAALDVMYESNGNDNADDEDGTDNADRSSSHVFSSQLNPFEIDHIGLQPDADVDVGLDGSNGTSGTSMTGILPSSANEQQRLPDASNVQAIVFISRENFATKVDDSANAAEQRCAIDPILLTEEFRGMPTVPSKVRLSLSAASLSDAETTKPAAERTFRPESSLQCHVCGEQGFAASGLKEHLTNHSGTKGYQCRQCFSRFCTQGGLIRHSKIHVGKRSPKGPSEEKRTGQRTVGRTVEDDAWNDVHPTGNAMASATRDPDSAVSEKVLLDTVAEREVMDRAENDQPDQPERKEYTNRCKYCPKTFRKPSDLVRHVRTHTGERPYKCDHCSKSFAVKCTLDSHTKVHTGKKTFRCHVCNSLFATKGSLKVHMRLHTGSKPFRCPICDSRFRTSGHRKVHLAKHAREQKENPKRRQKHSKVAAVAQVAADLEKCDGGADNSNGCESSRELRQHHLPETVAGYSHLETISIDTAAACLSDQISFDTSGIVSGNDQTVMHFLLTNGLVTIQTDESVLSQTQTASMDDARQPRLSIGPDVPALTHDAVHRGPVDRPIALEETIRAAEGSDAPATAANSAAPPDPFSRAIAEKSVPAETDRSPAKRNSSKECDICGKSFAKPYQVERHKRIHTGERPYKCDLCEKSFAQKSTLQMHQKHHTGDRPYACPYCEYSFTQKGNLRTHVKRVHQLDTADVKRWKRVRQSLLPGLSVIQESTIDAKALMLDDISFVEFLE